MIPNDIFLTFLATSCIACLLPGPAIIYAVSTTLSNGLKSGFIAIVGLQLGFLTQVIAASCGLSAILLTSGLWFSVLKILGAVYLMYLGLSIIFSNTHESFDSDETPCAKKHHPFLKGILINVLNPKIAIFFISYIPQFITNNGTSTISQVFQLGILFSIIGTLTTVIYALFGKALGTYFSRLNFRGILSRWLPGTIFIGFGIKLATSDK